MKKKLIIIISIVIIFIVLVLILELIKDNSSNNNIKDDKYKVSEPILEKIDKKDDFLLFITDNYSKCSVCEDAGRLISYYSKVYNLDNVWFDKSATTDEDFDNLIKDFDFQNMFLVSGNVFLVKDGGVVVAINEAIFEGVLRDYLIEYEFIDDIDTDYFIEDDGFDKLYMTGSQTFSVVAGDKKTVTISTNPANSKLILAYKGLKEDGSDKFTDYFKDCAVSIKTSYMTEAFSMAIADEGKELFLKTSNDDNEGDGTAVDLAFTITNKEGEVVTVEGFEANKTVYIKPAYAYTVTITPAKNGVDGGLVGLNITVDNGVTDEDVNITIPAEYLSTTATE